jgi:hypothetical protein
MKRTRDPLRILEVIDRLDVGPIRVEKQRVRATYTLTRGRKKESTELIYRFREDVFDPKDATAINLASMMAAQVAINYGLFCKTIVFHGSYDLTDRKFIDAAMQNTATEIFVKKILQPNHFIVGAAAQLPPVRRRTYVRSRLLYKTSPVVFSKKDFSHLPFPDKNRFTVLSSGGKESILSFCLLREMGFETHPIFANESGRHWYTALNSYRSFEKSFPHTTRVWTNVDRVMCWIERRLSFVRKNIHSSRSDEYPIRLWTLPLFLFGVLPLARTRGIANIIIGDEYDTSRRYSHRGIPHFDGLFDQSRFFDNMMSRYYKNKFWGFRQFSIVRPFSELLVQKILVSRYPVIQKDQVSCHATHIENGRVVPCGDCEKCRRIVGMLLALGKDPTRCGYKRSQIKQILLALPKQSFRQESAGAQHMAYLLSKKDLFPKSSPDAKPHDEVLQLRFDKEHSPPNAIPKKLRIPLCRICLRYSGGAAILRNGRWCKMNPSRFKEMKKAYPFEDRAD